MSEIAGLRALRQVARRVFAPPRGTRPGMQLRHQDGRIYQIDGDGAYRRVSPRRPWWGKAERRQVIRNRREDRDLAREAMEGSQ